MKIKCMIVEDEPIAMSILEKYVGKIKDLNLIAKCEDALSAFDVLKKEKIDLIFLDIQMPELTGIQFLKSLEKKPKVIITSAYRQYALEGFELEVLDYILKPVSFERFLKAVNKYYKSKQPADSHLEKLIKNHDNSINYILVKDKKKMVKIPFEKVLYIESIKDYVKIIMSHKTVITKLYLGLIEKKLPQDSFIRIHRSFIVSIDKIDCFSPNHVEIGEYNIPIGRNYKSLVLKQLNN